MFTKIFIIVMLFHASLSLYEDQAGKFDWYQRYVGKIKYFFIEKQNVPSRRIILTSENNVHAALHLYSGNIEWRQHLKEDDVIISVDYCKNHLITIVNVSGTTIMRVWDTIIGTILWEKLLIEHGTIKGSVKCNIDSENVIAIMDSHLYSIKLKNGNINWNKTVRTNIDNTLLKSELSLIKSIDAILVVQKSEDSFNLQLFNTSGEVISLPQSLFFDMSTNKCDIHNPTSMLLCVDKSLSQVKILYLNRQILKWKSVNFNFNSSGNVKVMYEVKIISSDKLLIIISDNSKVDNQKTVYIYNIIENNDSVKCNYSYTIDNIKMISVVEQDGKHNLVTMKFYDDRKTKNVELSFVDLRNGQEIKYLTNHYTLQKHHGSPIKMEPVLFKKKDSTLAYRLFLLTADHALHFWNQNGNALWMREESLADVVAVEMLDLPVSDTEAKMDEEFGHNQDNVLQKFIKRISTQLSQLKYFLQEQLKHSKSASSRYYSKDKSCQNNDKWNCESEDNEDNTEILNSENSTSNIATSLRRDSFNVHKMLVLTTGSGKIFGMESSTGQIVWRYLINNAITFKKNRVQLFILRTTAHFPHPPQAVLLMRCAITGYPLIFTFNPITGSPQTKEPQILKYRIYQATMLPLPVSEENMYSKPVLILDKDLKYGEALKVHIFPSTFRLSLDTYPIYIYRIDDAAGIVIGYEVKRNKLGPCSLGTSNDHDCYLAYEIWKLSFSSFDQKIATAAFRSPIEQVHSVGRILSDRNVLYKYLNPNLLSIVTESNNSSNPNCAVTLYLIDAVTGKIMYSTVHKKASGPINLVQSENWIVYSFQNLRSHRTEIAVLELYEPYEIPESIIYEIKDVDIEQLKRSIKSNKNDVGSGFDILSILGGERATTKKFSSKQRSRIETGDDSIISGPVVLKQGYIIGTYIRHASVSITEKGITSKSVLLALESGGIMELPKALLDPRRNFVMTPELIEEGVEPYIPEIPLRPFNIINYNQSVARVKNIYAGPSGLESTSLVFVYGLVAPSKMYDILKEDFDYVFIATVTIGMIIGAFITQRLAARRALYRSWQ